ncbi:Hexaprenyldihydroxybenzoate methyltransferase, mitochondrial [Pleodorina starrii]|uniref:Ubiquinone biosynthesis O-methyltransferase, mitochondrial n=1 Tax=Pleodorina starrii TaxID=330485 RepID=A0A9W6EYB7_9CHLO|nr:Hexaprenyldihydroxybenzoate methyltransferase [Pleodorina starrii]GLC49572.1 Hexaprenyldihydroxybenzoate methyltransferase, mitochondrial [Pleodorina starrii]GLC77267.1 Hexaprenyldihydroxybenzoate methyltransferase [Pleodorina starrii]
MIGKVESPMIFALLQPLALRHREHIRTGIMALLQRVATTPHGGVTNAAPPTALPALLPELPMGSQKGPAPGDARPSTSLLSPPALALPRPGPTAGPCGSPTLPAVPSGRQEDSPSSRTAGQGSPSAVSGSRTPSLPLLNTQSSCRWTTLGGPQTPAAASAAQQAGASSPPPRTPPAPLLRYSPCARPAGLNLSAASQGALTPLPRPAAPARASAIATAVAVAGPIPCPFSAPFATSALSPSDGPAADGAPTSPSTADAATPTTTTGATSPSSISGLSSPAGVAGPAGAAGWSPGARGASVDPREAAKFAAVAASWWRTTDGPFAPLHALNPARVRFIRQSLAALMGLDGEAPEPLAGLRVLDVGCGGGILSEALARLGAEVHGIDVTRENVEVARLHAGTDPRVAARVRYDVISAEDLAASGTEPYDVVIASEVLEHVSRPHQLLPVLTSLLVAAAPAEGRPSGGALVVSTLNRTPASWGVAIVGAEYVTGVVPRGTHQWRKFITPDELALMAGSCGLRVWHAAGMSPLGPRLSWQLSEDMSVNYIATLVRGSSSSSATGEGEQEQGRRQEQAEGAAGAQQQQQQQQTGGQPYAPPQVQ